MTTRIKRHKAPEGLFRVIQEKAHVNLNACYQCKKCSFGCPVADGTDPPPSEIIRRLQLGAGDELLQTGLIWTCLSCETCYARCPNEINFTAVIDALRALAVEKGVAQPEGDAPLFNRIFLETVRSYGRVYDLKAIAKYKMMTRRFKEDMKKLPAMLKKGKMAILPPTGANKTLVRRIFEKTSHDKGMGK